MKRITSDDRMVKVWRPHYQESKEVINMEKKHSQSQCAFNVEMPVSYRIRTEIPSKSNIRTIKGGYRIYTAKAVRREKGGNHRSGGMCRPHPYAREYSTAFKCSTVYGISQGKKYAHDIRPSREFKVQVRQPTLLVPWLLCRHGRKE